ncbi:hypothetical protein O1F58_004023 [Yersinia enterocolitica]|nr:hypothetical protein [Yersinia enterocolitica]EKN4914826.1 hypothetical protein [Yersinia enterocolitica]ELW8194527.1 hypothetical protein [Yersinia enterocolitica]
MIDKYLLDDLSRISDEKGHLARWVIQLQIDLDVERRKAATLSISRDDMKYRAEAAEAALSSANKKLNADPVLVCRINAGELQRLKNGSYAIVDAPERNPTDMGLFTGTQQKPVVLPEAYAVRAGHPINEGERNVMIPKQGGNWLSRFDVEHAIRAAGGKVEGE